ncbi:VanZ family protein [Fictibacillus aquaticus]|nr:VanZ family protein [Fictibacillus aquaticus]
MKKWIWIWLPVIVIAGLIFYSSSQPYEKQNVQPEIEKYVNLNKVEKSFEDVKTNYAGSEISMERLGPASFIEFYLRKTAHFTVFFVLSFFLVRAFKWTGLSAFRSFTRALLLASIYAALDETHQMFTSNRSPHFEDVILDIIGAIAGAAVGSIIFQKRQTSHKEL